MTILIISSKRNEEPVREDRLIVYLEEKLHTLLKSVSSLVIHRKYRIIN